ncbi:ligand-binding protein SH3 [Bacillus sp. Xin]|uniref:SH3 domain-containing protein n=1 Tax=unclassified Bacillus (in: firmicutes) TaxID=185979 RepID=UPI0015746274|nr:ligand-binding protein SH3 [Bacillus sp. Xin]NSW38974.1 ligand-binding protein SH3 [Bacillus sp. Xin1]
MDYKVIQKHESNYPNPISLKKGEIIKVGNKYEGPENWDNWVYCHTKENEGWVPEQIIKNEGKSAFVLEDYIAKELNVEEKEIISEIKELNGWLWCKRKTNDEKGWLPKSKLKVLDE